MASHWLFGHLSPKLWAKEGPRVKLVVWLPTTKSRESTSSRCSIRECNTSLERSRRGLRLRFRPRRDPRSGRGDMTSQSPGSPEPGHLVGFRDSNLGVPGKKCHFDVGVAERRRVYYMGEGGDFPRVRAVVCLVVQSARGLSQHPRVSQNVN
jgi:hypothetical protein